MSDDTAYYLRRLLIHIQANPEYLNFLTSYSKSFRDLCASSTASTSSTSDASSTADANAGIKRKLDAGVMTVSDVINPKLAIYDSHYNYE